MTTEPERLPFFVYGTLRPGEANHARILRGRTAAEEPAHIRGALLYDGPGYPYATDGPADAVVHGDLVRPRDADYDEVRAVLDRLEGHVPGAPDNLYERVPIDAVPADGRTVRAWVYLAAAPLAARLRSTAAPLAGGDWRGTRAEHGRPPAGPGRRRGRPPHPG
ncbi:gamma-glutamylcyclotransferase family protein [Streptomyces kronopolitis]|uniref:gamma-glutamylcyclotransferase family protein n=1 Tax=Streptomyces kronopolitis TaxID=1612435 RepID=UPI0020C11E55|nr:gamma-glutamylcyclotransferase family protein [Streptomyces kronopolitis]MCL6301304.1 gamma-glutamylcyclotransferase [Streptomyces kronopolitis]